MNIDNVRKAAQKMREAQDLLAHGPMDYYLAELTAAYDLLMTRYAPFKVGDHVRLKVAPEINERVRYGWLAWKLLLTAGATGIVSSAECGSRGFVFGVQFDADDSRNGKGEFAFSEEQLEKW